MRWILIAATLAATAPSVQKIVDKVVVDVNGEILTQSEIDRRLRTLLSQEAGREVTPGELAPGQALAARAAQLEPLVVADAIDELLVIQEARRLGLDVTDADVTRIVERIRTDAGATTDEAFAELLRQQGLDAADVDGSVRRQLLIQRVREHAFSKARVTDVEAESYFRAHASDFATGPGTVYRELLVIVPPLSDAGGRVGGEREHDQALIRFVRALDRVRAGEPFERIATEMSDAPSKANGGRVGPVATGDLTDPVRKTLASLRPGQISEPIRTADGYLVVKLERNVEGRPATFDALREEITTNLLSTRQAKAFTDLVAQLRSQAVLSWKDPARERGYAEIRRGRAR